MTWLCEHGHTKEQHPNCYKEMIARQENQNLMQYSKVVSWKTVGMAVMLDRSVRLELMLTCNLSKPCYISLKNLERMLSGDLKETSVYQMEP